MTSTRQGLANAPFSYKNGPHQFVDFFNFFLSFVHISPSLPPSSSKHQAPLPTLSHTRNASIARSYRNTAQADTRKTMTTTRKVGQGDTDTTANTNNISRNNVNATGIPATILFSALEKLMATDYNPITTPHLNNNSNITLRTDLARMPSMPDDPAISTVLAPFFEDLLQPGPDVTTSTVAIATGSKKVFKANKTGEKYTETDVLGEGVYKVVDRLGDVCAVKAPKVTFSVTQVTALLKIYLC